MNITWQESPKYTRNIIHEVTLEIYKMKNKTENAHITASEAEPADSVGALFFEEEGEWDVTPLRDFDGEGPAKDFGVGEGEGADLDFFGAEADFDFVGAEANGDEDGAWEGAERGVAAAETTTATFCPASQWPGNPHI